MTPDQIKEAVDGYFDLLKKHDELQEKFVKCSGRNIKKEIAIMRKIESIERLLKVVISTANNENILTTRECCAINHRLDGDTLKEIGEFFSLSHPSVLRILDSAYKKMAKAAQDMD